MNYVLVEIETIGQAFQELDHGVTRLYKSLNGEALFESIPVGLSSRVVDPNPTRPAWAIDGDSAEPTVEVQNQYVSKLEYMNRFTDEELAAIYSTAKSVVAIEVWLAKFNATAGDIDLRDSRTIAGVMTLEAIGLIKEGRAKEILNA